MYVFWGKFAYERKFCAKFVAIFSRRTFTFDVVKSQKTQRGI